MAKQCRDQYELETLILEAKAVWEERYGYDFDDKWKPGFRDPTLPNPTLARELINNLVQNITTENT